MGFLVSYNIWELVENIFDKCFISLFYKKYFWVKCFIDLDYVFINVVLFLWMEGFISVVIVVVFVLGYELCGFC